MPRRPTAERTITVSVEAAPKKAFATAVDWPGWSRSGKTEELALEALAASAARYARVAKEAGETLEPGDYDVVEADRRRERHGVRRPLAITDLDRRRVMPIEAERLAAFVEAAWAIFDRVSASAPPELRKGPRGGGRDRDKMIGHVVESDWYYAREIGIRHKQPDPKDRAAVDAIRAAVLEVLRKPSDGSPLADRKWPQRYAARRIAWHAVDHAWEMEDRSD